MRLKKISIHVLMNYLNEGNLNQYGILFDTLAAILEELFNINENREAFFLKHFLTFLFFFISSIFFYKIISERYNNNFFQLRLLLSI